MKRVMPVRQLSEGIVNRIAAGEVVERPASVVKELVENALDAGARRIDVLTDGGGRRLIRITDDGEGMTKADLDLAVERHATSKLSGEDLLDIRTLGFRGEALPSIGAVSRLTITTRHASEPHAWALTVDAGVKSEIRPAALTQGTTVEVRDLFYATPARLKFLKTDRSEAEAVREVVRRLAMSRPDVAFTLAGEERAPVTWGPAADELTRLGDVMGADFRANAHCRRGRARGRASRRLCRPADAVAGEFARPVPVRQRPAGARQGARRRGARGLCRLSAARPPSAARFVRHARRARGRRQRASGQDRSALPRRRAGARPDRARAEGGAWRATRSARPRPAAAPPSPRSDPAAAPPRGGYDWRQSPARPSGFAATFGATALGFAEAAQAAFDVGAPSAALAEATPDPEQIEHPLGAARAQIHENYIVAQTRDGLVIVDQHAAHERIVYERLKTALDATGVARQILLIPEIVELDEGDAARLVARADELARFGLVVESFGPGAVAVRETPSMLGPGQRAWAGV